MGTRVFFVPLSPLLRFQLRRTPSNRARTICSASRRRRHIGLPKNVQVGPVPTPPTTNETPWEDYIPPTLAGNSSPRNPSRFKNPGEQTFVVLGVETSCDDTAAAVVRSDGVILGEAAVGQKELTEAWGGVVPHVAREAHEQAVSSVIEDAISQAGIPASELDAVAATMGPGLEVCLRVGYRAARCVARTHDLDFVGVNHLEAHLLVARLSEQVQFPFATLLVSGGHCQLLLVRGVAEYEVLGGTLDDALGEAFDKTARLLGLTVGSGGGPALEALAESGNPRAIPFPIPMAKRHDCNFSFAGLKTSVRTAMVRLGGPDAVQKDPQLAADIAASFQEIAVRHLEQRIRRALQILNDAEVGANILVVAGGVAANKVVRRRLTEVCDKVGWRCVVPPMKLCTDNGVMVAWTGAERLVCGIADDTHHLDVRARWPLAGLSELASRIPQDVDAKAKNV